MGIPLMATVNAGGVGIGMPLMEGGVGMGIPLMATVNAGGVGIGMPLIAGGVGIGMPLMLVGAFTAPKANAPENVTRTVTRVVERKSDFDIGSFLLGISAPCAGILNFSWGENTTLIQSHVLRMTLDPNR